MPQMKPMNWLILFIILNMILMMINIMNFFIFNLMKNNNLMMKNNKSFQYWKW